MAEPQPDLDGSAGHQRVRTAITALIRRGVFRAHSRLPSDREVMAKLQVSRSDVLQAMNDLDADGLIVRRRRRRSYVAAPRQSAEPERLPERPDDTVSADRAEPAAPEPETDEPATHGPTVNGHDHGMTREATVPITVDVDRGAPSAVATSAVEDAVIAPPTSAGHLIWMRVRVLEGAVTLDLIKVHPASGGCPWLEARTIKVAKMPSLLIADLATEAVAPLLASADVAITRTSENAVLAREDRAMQFLRLKFDEPCLLIDEIGALDGETVMTGQWLRAADPQAQRRPRLRTLPRRRHRRPAAAAKVIEPDFGAGSWRDNAIRFGQFLMLIFAAVFRR